MVGLKGSFLGFTFGGIHSSYLNIVRICENGQLESDLIPESSQITSNATLDGTYFWNSKNIKRQKKVSFAFDNLMEEQLMQIKKFFDDKQVKELIFDEEPYKVWMAKITGMGILKHICFEDSGQRKYKGVGNLTFTCFYPYAKSRYQFQEDYVIKNIHEWIEDTYNKYYYDPLGDTDKVIAPANMQYLLSENQVSGAIQGKYNDFTKWLQEVEKLESINTNLLNVNSTMIVFPTKSVYNNYLEWISASGLPSKEQYGNYYNNRYKLFNAGDIDMPFRALYSISQLEEGLEIKIDNDNYLKLRRVVPKDQKDKYILIDTYHSTIEGYDVNLKPTKIIITNILQMAVCFRYRQERQSYILPYKWKNWNIIIYIYKEVK